MAVEATHNPVQDRVLSYLGQPSRTRANYYAERLAQAGFFTKPEDDQRMILLAVFEQAKAENGQDWGNQFRQFMGELLDPPAPQTRTVIVTTQIEADDDVSDVDLAEQVATVTGGVVTSVTPA